MKAGKQVLSLQFCAPVDENGVTLSMVDFWGFTVTSSDDEDVTYVQCGTFKQVKKFLGGDDNLIAMAVSAIRNSSNAMAIELLDDALDNETGIMLNGEFYEHDVILESIAEKAKED